MLIRKAKPEESKKIASLILLAMEDIIFNFIGENSQTKAIHFLESLIQEKGNQYSYENCWVGESKDGIIVAAIVYNGEDLQKLREPVAHKIKEMFDKPFSPEDETQTGEYYIDCVGVEPNIQGKGIGSKMFQFLIDEYVEKNNQTLGLLVDKDNPNAKKLYLKLGFEIVAEKTLVGKHLEHLQYKN